METSLEIKILSPIVANYEGDLDANQMRYEGEGSIQFDNSASYTGTFHNGLFHGKGVYLWPNQVQYDGEFSQGAITGNGKYSWPDQSQYSGEVLNGKRHGTGVFEGSSQQYYEGLWENGLRHGYGVMNYNQQKSIIYRGHWEFDQRHGFGTMTYESGNVYEGEWSEDKKSGTGVMLWADKSEIYLGQWSEDLPNGQGEQIWFDTPSKSFHRQICNIYRGEWKNGMRNGYGCFFYANGSQYSGHWVNNLKHGLGTFIHPNGRIVFGEYASDRLVNPTLDLSSAPPPLPLSLPGAGGGAGHDDLSYSQFSSSHKSIGTTTATGGGGAGGAATNKELQQGHGPVLRETESVNAQFHLNINDVLSGYPVLLSNKTSHANQTKDIERLILRYNSPIRLVLKKYSLAANVFRTISLSSSSSSRRARDHPSLRPPTAWGSLELILHNKRAISEKFFTLQMQQLWQLARDCELIGPLLTAYDICQCVQAMHKEHNQVAKELHCQHLKQQIQALLPAPAPAPPQALPIPPQSLHSRPSSSAANILRRKSGGAGGGSTKVDSNGSLHSSRSAKGITAIATTTSSATGGAGGSSARGAGGATLKRGGSKIRLLEIKEQRAEEEHELRQGQQDNRGNEEKLSLSPQQQQQQLPLDPKLLSLQAELESLTSSSSDSGCASCVPRLLDTSFEREVYHDALFPIREREFVELLIRIIAEATCRKPTGGLSSGGLFDAVYRTFAEVLEPLASESRPIPVFTLALYSESVQLVLRKRASAMRSLWDQVLEIANQDQEHFTSPQVKHVVKLMRALRGTAIAQEGSSVLEILEVINKKGPNDDVSSLDLHVMFDDFVELLCRLVVSNLWIFAVEDNTAALDHRVTAPETTGGLPGAAAGGQGEGMRRQTSRVSTVTIVEQALAKRLSEWLKMI